MQQAAEAKAAQAPTPAPRPRRPGQAERQQVKATAGLAPAAAGAGLPMARGRAPRHASPVCSPPSMPTRQGSPRGPGWRRRENHQLKALVRLPSGSIRSAARHEPVPERLTKSCGNSRRVGAELLLRSYKGIEFTDAGQILLTRARLALVCSSTRLRRRSRCSRAAQACASASR